MTTYIKCLNYIDFPVLIVINIIRMWTNDLSHRILVSAVFFNTDGFLLYLYLY